MIELGYQVHAVARSAHHSFIAWLASGCRMRPVYYRNNVDPSKNPDEWDTRSRIEGLQRMAEFKDAKTVIESGEVWRLDAPRFIEVKRSRVVIFMRDPFNNLASYVKGFRKEGSPRLRPEPTFARERWIYLAKESLRHTEQLDNVTLVLFHKWRYDPVYRHYVATQLGITPNERLVEHVVSAIGGGSSFDGLQYRGKSGEMAVQERYKIMSDDDEFRSLIDDEVIDLSRELFPDITEEAVSFLGL
jgi:hypothetical protein